MPGRDADGCVLPLDGEEDCEPDRRRLGHDGGIGEHGRSALKDVWMSWGNGVGVTWDRTSEEATETRD